MLVVTGGNPVAVTTGSLIGEAYRTGAYFVHEKIWEEKPVEEKKSLPEEYKKDLPDQFL